MPASFIERAQAFPWLPSLPMGVLASRRRARTAHVAPATATSYRSSCHFLVRRLSRRCNNRVGRFRRALLLINAFYLDDKLRARARQRSRSLLRHRAALLSCHRIPFLPLPARIITGEIIARESDATLRRLKVTRPEGATSTNKYFARRASASAPSKLQRARRASRHSAGVIENTRHELHSRARRHAVSS